MNEPKDADPISETAVDALACTLVNRYTFMQSTSVDAEYPDAQTVHLRVGNQSFRINDFCESQGHAQWMMNMLAKALARIVLEQQTAAPKFDLGDDPADHCLDIDITPRVK